MLEIVLEGERAGRLRRPCGRPRTMESQEDGPMPTADRRSRRRFSPRSLAILSLLIARLCPWPPVARSRPGLFQNVGDNLQGGRWGSRARASAPAVARATTAAASSRPPSPISGSSRPARSASKCRT